MPCNDRNNHHGMHQCRALTVIRPRWRRCEDRRHAARFTVCSACADQTVDHPINHLAAKPWIRIGIRLVRLQTPDPRQGPNTPQWFPLLQRNYVSPWPGFLTRLCRYCEAREYRIRHNQSGVGPQLIPEEYRAGAGMVLKEHRLMEDAPLITCTCYKRLVWQRRNNQGPPPEYGYRHCVTHRREILHEMFLRKEANDQWLRNTDLSKDGVTAKASLPTRNRRAANGTWRACRCGADVDLTNVQFPADVLMCMCCEGIVFQPNSVIPQRYEGPMGYRHDRRPIALQRPRSRLTAQRARSVND